VTRLVHPVLEEPIEINSGAATVLVLENAKAFRDLTFSLLDASLGLDSDVCLSREYTPLVFSKSADLISFPPNADPNSRRILNYIHQQLSDIAVSENYYIKTSNICSEINRYILEILDEFPCNLTAVEIDPLSLIKAVKAGADITDISLAERLCDYMEIVSLCSKIEIFIFISLKDYLEREELREFYKFAAYKGYKLMLVESHERDKIKGEVKTVYDCDYCRII